MREPTPQRESDIRGHVSIEDPLIRVDRLTTTLVERANGLEGRTAASRLDAALRRLPRSVHTRDFLNRHLDEARLDRCFDLDDVSCRVALIDALLRLGYPWALEVSPEDLALLRREATRQRWRGFKSRVATILTALGSGAWGLLWLLTLGRSEPSWLMVPFAVGFLHALGALGVAAVGNSSKSPDARGQIARGYFVLGWAVLCGPVFSVIAALALDPGAFWLGMTFAGPSMLTAGCCAVAGLSLRPAWRASSCNN